MAGFVGRLAFRGLRKGVVEGSRPWMVVGVAAGVVALARRAAKEPPEVLARAELKPGERLVVDALGAPLDATSPGRDRS